MITTVKVSTTTCGALIPLGRCMEDDVRSIVFDCSSMEEDFGTGTASLVHQRSQDAAPYSINMTADENTYTWVISNTDTAYTGIGSLELRWTTTDGLGKSVTYRTQVLSSITGDVTIPDPLESWYDAMIDYIDENSITEEDLEQAVSDYLEEHPVTAPVTSVNSEIGDVVLTASDVGAYELPSGGIPKADLASDVQTSLGKADTALQTAPVTSVNSKTGAVSLSASDVGAYALPSGGIPSSDLSSAVQTSLGKADTALQSAPVSSVDGKTGTVTVIPSGGTQGYVLKKASATDYDVEWAAESGGSSVSPSDTAPVMDGTAAAGSSTAYARGDHVHPSDTTRQATADRVTTTPCTSEKNATTKYYSASAAWAWMNKIVPGYYSTGPNQSGNGWKVGDYCNMGGKLYRCTTACNNEAFAANHWTEITDLSDDIVKQVLYQIAAEYDSTATYALGAYCIRQKALYKCTTAISTAEAWTAAHWTATTVSAELAAISVPSPSSSTPQPLGTAAAGSSTDYSRADHVHAMPTASQVGAYAKPSGGIPKTDLASAVQTSLGKADTALQTAPVSSVNTRTGAVTGLQEETTIVNKTSSDTSQTLEANKFYIWPEMSALTITCPATGGPFAFRFTSGSTATTLTMTGITMPDDFVVEASKVYEINVYQGYGLAVSWEVSV